MKGTVRGSVITDDKAAELEVLWKTSWGNMSVHQYEQLMRWYRVQRGELEMGPDRSFTEEYEMPDSKWATQSQLHAE